MIQRTLGVLQGETWKESFNSWTRGKKKKKTRKAYQEVVTPNILCK